MLKGSTRCSNPNTPGSTAFRFSQGALSNSSRLTTPASPSTSARFALEPPPLGRKLALRRALIFSASRLKGTTCATDMHVCPKKTRKSKSKKKCSELATDDSATTTIAAEPPAPPATNAAPPTPNPPPPTAHPVNPLPASYALITTPSRNSRHL